MVAGIRHKVQVRMCIQQDSNQSVHPHSMIRVLVFHLNKHQTLGLPIEWASKTLIRLRICAGWSESSMGSYVNLYVLLDTGSDDAEWFHVWLYILSSLYTIHHKFDLTSLLLFLSQLTYVCGLINKFWKLWKSGSRYCRGVRLSKQNKGFEISLWIPHQKLRAIVSICVNIAECCVKPVNTQTVYIYTSPVLNTSLHLMVVPR